MRLDELFKTTLRTMQRYGFAIDDDETISDVGLAVTHTVLRWTPRRSYTPEVMACRLASRLLARRKRLNLVENLDQWYTTYRKGYDNLQQALMGYPEPDRSIAFAVFIEGKQMRDVCASFRISLHTLNRILDDVAEDLRFCYEDSVL